MATPSAGAAPPPAALPNAAIPVVASCVQGSWSDGSRAHWAGAMLALALFIAGLLRHYWQQVLTRQRLRSCAASDDALGSSSDRIKSTKSLPDFSRLDRAFARAGHRLKRSRSWDRVRSPLQPVRVAKQRFGHNIATALDERSATRFTLQGSTARRKTSRETMPPHPTRVSSDTLSAGPLPTDDEPWDRLHVWLVAGEHLPHRPWLWPFEPYVVVTSVGDNTGSTPEVPIGAYEFQVRAPYMNASRPVWDERGLVCFKRGGASGFRVVVMGSGKLWSGLYPTMVLNPLSLIRWICAAPMRLFRRAAPIPSAQVTFSMPAVGGEWQEVHVPLACGEPSTSCSGFITLRVRVSVWEDRTVSVDAMRAFKMEHTVLEGSDGDRAVVSYHLPLAQVLDGQPRRAMLWLPGRNDAFFHPHVGALLVEHGIDLYVLNYRRVGECRQLWLFDNPMRNSHCKSGNFAEYHDDVKQALEFMHQQGGYTHIIGYSHSTGSPVLLDYLMAHGDADFCGFVFNSPFLDWGWVGGRLSKFLIVHLPSWLTWLRVWSDDGEILGGGGPSAWALQLFSQYAFDPGSRPLFTVPLTVGYCRGVNRVHAALRRHSAAGAPITQKPFVVLTSKGDDVLNGDETMLHAHAIGPNRTLIELMYARHDVFASADVEVVAASLAYLETWLKSQHFV